MTPSSAQSRLNQLNFGKLNGRQVIANFEGGRMTSDAGIVLIAELDKKLKITDRFSECFQDHGDAIFSRRKIRRSRRISSRIDFLSLPLLQNSKILESFKKSCYAHFVMVVKD